MKAKRPKRYNFPDSPEDSAYQLFPDVLENDPNVFFHGTAASNLTSIIRNGFRATKKLCSVSFVTTSPVALKYACDSRGTPPQDGVVIAVRFDDLTILAYSGNVVHLHDLTKQPQIIGTCVVPADYKFR